MQHYDRSYKKLFSHPEMVVHLLRLIRQKWVGELEWDSLQRVNPVLQSSRRSQERQADMVWRILWKGEWLYLLLEFQSSVDPQMPVRLLACTALQYQEMVREGLLSSNSKYPSVLSLVVYTGPRAWKVPLEIREMIGSAPEGMESYVPRHRHILLDATRDCSRSGADRGNLVNALFCLEACRSPLELLRELGHLNQLLAQAGRRELRRSFADWLHQAYLPSRLGKRFPEIREADIEEVKKMIELREDAWCLQWEKEGMKKGKREGLRSLLLRQLGLKFGRIDKGCLQRIEEASEERLLDWGERLLSAGTLEQVFGE